MKVESVTPENYAEMLIVWESSVRATHEFITEADIEYFKPLIMEKGFPKASLRCVKGDDGAIWGFVGVCSDKIEMMFIANLQRGLGIGRILLEHAINELGATKVDVNEQNPLAVGFYLNRGFTVTRRTPYDCFGNARPILHMSL